MKRLSTPIVATGLVTCLFACAAAAQRANDRPPAADNPPNAIPGIPVLPTRVDVGTRTLRVGLQREYATPSAAAAVARDGDTIEIASGDYHGDVAIWNAHRLKIVGATPRPHVFADGKDVQGKGLWLVRGDDVSIENVELSGARVPEGNGAAIRLEGRNLLLRNDYVHDNENGLLAGVNPTSEVTIEHCEFARNGNGTGNTHNIYVGAIGRLTVTRSYLHHAIVGHNLKSRAAVSVVSDNRLADEADGRASYEADFPNGGRVTLTFNVFQKGNGAENPTLVAYGAEGLTAGGTHELIVKGNTFVNQRGGNTRYLSIAPGTRLVSINSNVFAGGAQLPDVAGIKADNAVQAALPGNADLKPEGFK